MCKTIIIDKGSKDTFFLMNNVSDIWSDITSQLLTSTYVWFDTSINQEIQFQSIPPYFMALV